MFVMCKIFLQKKIQVVLKNLTFRNYFDKKNPSKIFKYESEC